MIVEIHSIQSGMAEEGEITFWKCGAGINQTGRPHKPKKECTELETSMDSASSSRLTDYTLF